MWLEPFLTPARALRLLSGVLQEHSASHATGSYTWIQEDSELTKLCSASTLATSDLRFCCTEQEAAILLGVRTVGRNSHSQHNPVPLWSAVGGLYPVKHAINRKQPFVMLWNLKKPVFCVIVEKDTKIVVNLGMINDASPDMDNSVLRGYERRLHDFVVGTLVIRKINQSINQSINQDTSLGDACSGWNSVQPTGLYYK